MSRLNYIAVNVFETLLRVIPIPCKTGAIKIGNPGRNAPVLLTCNYHLTVKRVKRALNGIDCYLLVSSSNGHNVWCGAAGGHFTNHSVTSVLKTSGVDKLVDHRNVILPQLAGAGIEAEVIQKKTGWRVIWGPVYAKDIRKFIDKNFYKSIEMRTVEFLLPQRVEMAIMWAFPFSIIASLIMAPVWAKAIVPLDAIIWVLPFLIFIFFPFYSKRFDSKRKNINFSKYTIIFDFARLPLILWGFSIVGLFLLHTLSNPFSWQLVFRWSLIFLIVILIISMDLTGSTPIYKSGLHEDRFLKIALDEQKCKGDGVCEQICPRNCYQIDADRHLAAIPGAEKCIQCGACVVQCQFDALYFVDPRGTIIPPETVRKFKLNLIGKRLKRTK